MAEEKEFDPRKVNLFDTFSEGQFTAGSTTYRANIESKVDAQYGVNVIKYGPGRAAAMIGGIPNSAAMGDSADKAETIVNDARREAAMDSPMYVSLADRVARDEWFAVERGKITSSGDAVPNLLTEDEEEYFGSGGEEGSYADAMGLTTYGATGRPVNSASPSATTETKVAWLALNAPNALAAISSNGLKPADVATVHNVFVAQAAVQRAIGYLEVGENAAAGQLISSLPVRQRILAAAFMDSQVQERSIQAREAQAQAVADEAATTAAVQASPAANLDPVASRGAPMSARGVSKGDTTTDPANWYDPLLSLLNATLWGVEKVTQGARVLEMMRPWSDFYEDPVASLTPVGGEAPDISSVGARLSAAWEATSEGFISEKSYTELTQKYGKKNTDLMLAFYQAQTAEDPEAVQEFYASIDGDGEATAFLTSALRGENVGGDKNNGAELFADIAARDQGNLGNLTATNFRLTPGTAGFNVTRDAVNVYSWFAYDPLNFAFGAGKLLRASKYGLDVAFKYGEGSFTRGMANMLRAETIGPGPVASVPGLNRNGVRILFDDFGAAVKRWVEAPTAEAQADTMNAIRKKFFKGDNKMLTFDDFRIAKDRELYSAEDWAAYYDEMDNAERLLRGEVIPVRPPADGSKRGMDYLNQFTPEARARQTEKARRDAEGVVYADEERTVARSSQQAAPRRMYVPHTTIARDLIGVQFANLSGRYFHSAETERAMKKLEKVFGPEWAQADPETQMAVLIDQLSTDAEIANLLGYTLGDFAVADDAMKRTVAGRAVDAVFDRSEATRKWGARLGLYRKEKVEGTVSYQKVKGWKRDRSIKDPAESLRASREQVKRTLSRMPNLPHGLNVETAEHAQEVALMVKAAGMGDGLANIIRSAWITASPAERQNMMIGLTRSFVKALGIHAVDPTAEARILSQMTGIGWKELYATNQVPRRAGVIAEIRREAAEEAEAARQKIIKGKHVDLDGRVAEIDELLAATPAKARKPKKGEEFDIPHPDPAKPARRMKAGHTGENKLNRQPDGSAFPGNWRMDPDPFPVAHMDVPEDIATLHDDYLAWSGIADEVPAVDYQLVRVNPDRQKAIADAYEDLPVSAVDDAEVQAAYDDLVRETEEQARFLRERGITIEIVDEDPYANPAEMMRDVAENRRIRALSTRASNSSHPYLTDEQNDLFRAVHDFFGHAMTGRGFDMHGEEAAWLAHSRMFSGNARRALTTETRGQNSWHHVYGESKRFADQKVALLPQDIVDDALSASFTGTKVGRTPTVAPSTKPLTRAERAALQKERQSLVARRNSRIQEQLGMVRDGAFIKRKMKLEKKKGGRLNPDDKYNPSVDPTGKASGVYMGQTSDYMAVPDFRVLDRYAARSSYLNALLFNNRGGEIVTNLWVLGTLAGPRFQIRNATEDGLMYGLTGGKVGSFFRGRRLGQAIDANMARVDKEVLGARDVAASAERRLLTAQRDFAKGRNEVTEADVQFAEEQFTKAQKDLNDRLTARTFLGRQKYGDHAKLGVVRTTLVNLSERATYVPGTDRVRDGFISNLAQFFVPTTSSFERAQAAELGREAVADLASKAVLRQKLVWNRGGLAKLIPARAKSLDDLSPEQRLYMEWERDLLESPFGLQFKDDAAETASHYADGGLPSLKPQGNYSYAEDGTLMQRVPVTRGYTTEGVSSKRLDERQARAMMARLRFMTDKFSIHQAAMHQIPDYWRAVNRVGGADMAKADAVLDNVLAFTRSSSDWPYIAGRFRLADDLGAKEHIRRMMDDMTDAFTTRGGDWNQKLWRSLRHQDEKGKAYFTTAGVDDADPIVSEIAFMRGEFQTPASVLAHKSDDAFLVPVKSKPSTVAWEMMGRSLARMTRNPIWYGNYIEARKQLAPLQRHYASIFGDTHASRVFTDAAAERAYNLTMAWVDNPSVKTALAWQVRNIARYYRAQEDFARRMIRMVKYDPGSIQKANLAWQAQQDFGFTYTDQYGEDYFIYPGSAAVMGVLQNLFGGLGIGGMKYGVAPMAFGGKVQWLSPSLDPSSWLPTVSSPWMALTLQPLLRTMPAAEDFFKSVERWAMGDITANMDYTDLNLGDGLLENVAGGFYQTLPPVVKRLIAVGEGITGAELRGGYGYKMTAKTIMAMHAAGLVPQGEQWADENVRREFLQALEQRTIEIGLMSAIFGLVLPASPQYMEDYESIAARAAGYESLNPALREMIQASVDSGATWEEGTIRWMGRNPQDAAFVTPTSESIGGTYVEATQRNVDFIKANRELMDRSPIGMTFFMPDEKGSSSDDGAWQAMKMFDLRRYRSLEDILNDVANAQGDLDTSLAAVEIEEMRRTTPHYDTDGNITPEWRQLDEAERVTEAKLKAKYKTRQQGLGDWFEKEEGAWAVEANQIVDVARALAKDGSSFAQAAMPLVDAYAEFSVEYNRFKTSAHAPGTYDEVNSEMKDVWERVILNWWSQAEGSFPEDRAEKMVKVFTYALSKGWTGLELRPSEEATP